LTSQRLNNFSTLRITFATLVILSHSFEFIDGNRSREILTRLFGSISFGVLSVDGFFIVSGYLIAKSFNSSSRSSYILKRILRIYPGFVVAFLISLLICSLSSGLKSIPSSQDILTDIVNLVWLLPPMIQNAYPGSFYPAANSAMWTISYEFHCYLMVFALGVAGLLKRDFVGLVALVLLTTYLIQPDIYISPLNRHLVALVGSSPNSAAFALPGLSDLIMEDRVQDIRLFGIFLVGSCFYLFRDNIIYETRYAAIASILLVCCLFSKHAAEPGLAVFGGYIIFWFTFGVKPLFISEFFNQTDLSYGIYLYGWPVQKMLISQLPSINPYELFLASLLVSSMLAYFSWKIVEAPFLNLAIAQRRQIPLEPALTDA
jgi:peptidoglycan/LPS O-acetylase OafA/YrhL